MPSLTGASQAATTAAQAANRPAPPAAGTPTLSADFETFLRMLTTQMQNQDPLNPMQSSDFAVQLATFSGVEQAVRTNQLLESMLTQSGLSELAGLVGLSARASGPARFDGSGVALSLPAMGEADTARLLVRDAMGQVVDSDTVPVTGGAHVWRGLGADGTMLPAGLYSFEVAGYRGGQMVDNAPAESFSEIVEARRDGADTVLVMSGGQEVALSEITALRGSPR